MVKNHRIKWIEKGKPHQNGPMTIAEAVQKYLEKRISGVYCWIFRIKR